MPLSVFSIPYWLGTLLTLTHGMALAENTEQAPQWLRLKENVPTLDLATPQLESTYYAPLGLSISPPQTEVLQAVLNYEITIPQAYSPDEWSRCGFLSVQVEIDDLPTTQEWLITPDNACHPVPNSGIKPFWIVQQTPSQPTTVLIADRATQVRIWQLAPHQIQRSLDVMRAATVPSQYTQRPTDVQCHTRWQFDGKQFRPDQHSVEVYREDALHESASWLPVDKIDPYTGIDERYTCQP